LSHEQIIELRSVVKHSGTGVQGHSLTQVEVARALLHINEYRQHGLSFNVAVKATAKGELVSPSTLRTVQQQFIDTGTLPQPSTAHRGKGNPDHPLHSNNTDEYGPSLKAELLIHELVHTQKTENISITSTTIAAELRAKLDVCVHRSTVRRWLHALGYRWRHKRYVGGMKPQAKNVRIRQFILEYAEALAADEAGTAIIVYTDESYIHSHHASKKGWFHPSNRDVIGDDDGKRLIILHAMTSIDPQMEICHPPPQAAAASVISPAYNLRSRR
jgi:hypothetical protein